MNTEEARDFQTGDRVRVVLNAEVLAISQDKEWLFIAPESLCKIWVPVDEFVSPIEMQPTQDPT